MNVQLLFIYLGIELSSIISKGCCTLADFFRRTADFLLGLNQVKICWAISLHSSRFFVVTNRVEAWRRDIQNQDCAYSTRVTLMAFPNWLRHARAPTNCLGPPHTSREGPTRPFEI